MFPIVYIIPAGTWLRVRKGDAEPRAHQTSKELVFHERLSVNAGWYQFQQDEFVIAVKQDRVTHMLPDDFEELRKEAERKAAPLPRKKEMPTLFAKT